MDHEVFIQEVTLPPGRGTAPEHRHDAFLYAYVLEGALETQLKGGEVLRVGKGEIFTEGPDDLHVMLRNLSDAEPARFLVLPEEGRGTRRAAGVAGHRVSNPRQV